MNDEKVIWQLFHKLSASSAVIPKINFKEKKKKGKAKYILIYMMRVWVPEDDIVCLSARDKETLFAGMFKRNIFFFLPSDSKTKFLLYMCYR